MMNELKPEDVMRALECHSLADISTCDDCPYCDISEQGYCGCDMAKDALALLRENDAEIEKLKNSISFQVVMPDEKLEEIKAECLARVELDINAIRAKAITEFAERLKAHECLPEYPWDEPFVLAGCIDQIAKELKGEQE